jgi:hypothetical protein
MKGGLRGWRRHCFSCLRPTNQAALTLAPELVHGHVGGEAPRRADGFAVAV